MIERLSEEAETAANSVEKGGPSGSASIWDNEMVHETVTSSIGKITQSMVQQMLRRLRESQEEMKEEEG